MGKTVNSKPFLLRALHSGGQRGADVAALYAGRRLGLKTGGVAPAGYRTEDGPDPALKEFGLVEDTKNNYQSRTIRNVQETDGTAWFGNTDSPGGRLTIKTARWSGKPLIINPTAEQLRVWVLEHAIRILNAAGNRESKNPGIQVRVEELLVQAFAPLVKNAK